MVIRPTPKGEGKIQIKELGSLLKALGYDFLVTEESIQELTNLLDGEGRGYFQEDELIDYLCKNHFKKYCEANPLREALKMFDFDNDGKIKFQEFEYFMRNFGMGENDTHMNEERLQKLFADCKPLDAKGNIEIEKVVKTLTGGWS